MSGPTLVARPRRVRFVCWPAAAAVVAVTSVAAAGLHGGTGAGGTFGPADQVALAILGLLLAGAILLFTRPRVVADERGVKVRNLLASYELPWTVVRAVRFDESASWATLELADDEQVALLAVQAVDGEHALVAVRALRDLLARSRHRTEGG